MGRWKAFIGIGLVFILGILVGLVPGFYFTHRFPPPPPPPSMDRGHGDEMILERLSKDLSLTEEQKAVVKPIVTRMNERLHEHFENALPEISRIFNEGFAQMEKELTDPQKARLRAMRERMERRPPPPFRGGPSPGMPPFVR